jgi:DNA-binding transcriptional ArsR family regulator
MPRKRKKNSRDQALLTCLQHPLRKRLLVLYVEAKEKRSPRELADLTGEHLSKVSYHVRVLADNKAVKLVSTKPRRGSVEHFYKATRLVDEVPWGRVALGLSTNR